MAARILLYFWLLGAFQEVVAKKKHDPNTHFKQADDHVPTPWYSIVLSILWIIPVLAFWLYDFLSRPRRRLVDSSAPPVAPVAKRPPPAEVELMTHFQVDAEAAADPEEATGDEPARARAEPARTLRRPKYSVLCASLEHSVPQLPKARAVAGGLGKVMDLLARHHPGDLIMVHPMVGPGADGNGQPLIDYGSPVEDPGLRIKIDGVREEVRVFRHEVLSGQPNTPKVTFLLLSHPVFEARTTKSIYPNPMTRRAVLKFFSLWNQCVGALLVRHRIQVYHCPDFHTALASWYALPELPNLRVLVVLHNAEYQGSISTDMLFGDKLESMAKIFNLPKEVIHKHCLQDGRFNMLKAAIDFVVEKQNGVGVCAVSQNYAKECQASFSLMWRLPQLDGLDNPMLEEERARLTDDLFVLKAASKQKIQEHFKLNVDPEARIFVSLGRLVRQKGVDLLADVAPWILESFPKAQLIVVGPPADGFGAYAASKLKKLSGVDGFKGRLYVCCEFVKVPPEMKFAADFCLMPSRDEPFGYVDIEFAWHGAILVGAQAGGLGKVPGFYYVAQNRENLGRLRRELRTVISLAMQASPRQLERMSLEAIRSDFPLDVWQQRLLELYDQLNPPAVFDPRQSINADGTTTFLPYASADVGRVSDAGPPTLSTATVEPISMIENAGETQARDVAPEYAESPDEEFLVQELSEAQLCERVEAKIAECPEISIDDVLERVGADLDLEREKDPWGKWLLKSVFDVAIVHWIVAFGYVMSPVGNFLVFVVAAEWGNRGHMYVPKWVLDIPGWTALFGGDTPDISAELLNAALFSASQLAVCIGTPIWCALSRVVSPRRLLTASLFLQLPTVAMIAPTTPRFTNALFLVFVQGLASSSSLLFIVFSYMMSIRADMSKAALRMGMLEMLRCGVTWLLTAYIFLASPTSKSGTAATPLPIEVTMVLLPIAVLAFICLLVPGLLLLKAPGPYREDRFPGWDLELITKKKTFLILSLSDCVGGLAMFPSISYISWWLANGWTDSELSTVCVWCGLFVGIATYLYAQALSMASVHGFSFLIALTVLLAPPGLLRALVQDEVSTFTNVGKSDIAMIIVILSLLLEGMRGSAIWTAKIRILGSRWRLLSFGTVFLTLTNFFACISPGVCIMIARRWGTNLLTRNQKELADAVLVSLVPLMSIQFVLQALAAPFIHNDMGISVTGDDTDHLQHCTGWTFLRNPNLWPKGMKRSYVPLAFGIGLSFSIFVIGQVLASRPPVYDQVLPCANVRPPKCRVVKDETDNILAKPGYHYGKNRFGQETTGRFNCAQRMRSVGGDTFVFWNYGRCRILDCQNVDSVTKPDEEIEDLHGYNVWSRHCTQSGQNLVGVHLFEWSWNDIAQECKNYLGPAGFNYLQVSPPQEHILGDSWSSRYQPVSYKLDSRGGTEEEFARMVAECRSVGVEIMVDTVLNHMASPYLQWPEEDKGKVCGGDIRNKTHSTRKCVGWSGTEFGNREMLNGKEGLDYFQRKDFHHNRGDDRTNCGYPPETNNRHLCDLSALPDLDTESNYVRSSLQAFLFKMFEMGVTMLRVDASMCVYPESLGAILSLHPWQYLVFEFYPDKLRSEPATYQKVTSLASLTDFDYGQMISQILFDYGGRENPWVNKTFAFGDLLLLDEDRLPNCGERKYGLCDIATPSSRALVFLDNHDQQRERWKPPEREPFPKPKFPWTRPTSPICNWDGTNLGNCRLNYKHGQLYHMSMLFMLAWPQGDALRIMSSYAWQYFNQGPPGVRNNSGHDHVDPVRCRGAPQTTPVTKEYDFDTERGWVCEHRWDGVAGLVRFRKLVGADHKVIHRWSDYGGHASFALGEVGFVALHRGYNHETMFGSNATFNLTGRETGMPAGTYCNLARESTAPVKGHCAGDTVTIDLKGVVAKGFLPSGMVVAIHVEYPAGNTEVVDEPEVTVV